ncbi:MULTISPECIES: hypothetical protein [Cellulomonas]|uniref:hypothetical protein n=1 Tax=Cellulomonas TaxID=1707 RepID=UPI00069C307D|nr:MULTISPECIES: hypothetical protein [Cellulomonas]
MPAPRPVPAAEVLRPRDPAAEVYVDGSALSRYVPQAPESSAWSAWAAEHEATAVVSSVSVLEARVVAGLVGVDAALAVLDALVRLPRLRLSDQALRRAVLLPAGLGPFVALHVGAAQAHLDVRAVATYDAPTARAADAVGLAVVTPGRPTGWWR